MAEERHGYLSLIFGVLALLQTCNNWWHGFGVDGVLFPGFVFVPGFYNLSPAFYVENTS